MKEILFGACEEVAVGEVYFALCRRGYFAADVGLGGGSAAALAAAAAAAAAA